MRTRALIALRGAAAAFLAGTAAAQSTPDIREIRGPKAVPLAGSSLWLTVLAGVLIAAALGAFIWYLLRHRRPTLTPSQQALKGLEEARSLMQPGSAREFGIAASEVIRRYIERRFGMIATQRTTEEFLQALLQSPEAALSQHRALLAEFLQQCDLIKFAGAGGALSDLESLLSSARGFVQATSGPSTP